ncbi:MAG: malonyl-ACP O-methyltransferase BioC [Pseudomonadota bacterium]
MNDEFLIDKRLVRRSFERAAATYDRAAVLQRTVGERMAERLQYIRYEPQVILDAGSGTGYASRLLHGRYGKAQVVSLDIARSMLKAARDAGPWWRKLWPVTGRDAYVCGDIERLPLRAGSVDMIWSNLALQWCNDLDAAFAGMHRVLAPNGLLMFSTFGPDTLKELRQAFAGVDGHTHVSRFLDMHDIGDALVRAGFATPVMDVEHFTLTYGDARSLMRDLKALGAHNATSGRQRGLFGKGVWHRLERNYEALRRDGKLPATYEVVYGHAWKPEISSPRTPDGGQVIQFASRNGAGKS